MSAAASVAVPAVGPSGEPPGSARPHAASPWMVSAPIDLCLFVGVPAPMRRYDLRQRQA